MLMMFSTSSLQMYYKVYVFDPNKRYFTFTAHKQEFERHCYEDLMVLIPLKRQHRVGFKNGVKTRVEPIAFARMN